MPEPERQNTKPEVAARGRCSVDKVNRDIKSGLLAANKIGPRHVLIPESAVADWLAGRPAAAKAPRP